MAFGLLLTTKWGTLRRPLQTKLKSAGKVFLAITSRLHNFCINEHSDNVTAISKCNEIPFIPSDIGFTTIEGNSMMWDMDLYHRALKRPHRP
jgi:hypothetical protein